MPNPNHLPAGTSKGGQFTSRQLGVVEKAARVSAGIGPRRLKIKTPLNAYHITYSNNVESIKLKGLRPWSESGTNTAQGDIGEYSIDGVFLANASQAQIIYSRMLEESEGSGISIIEAYLPKGTLIFEDKLMPESSIIVKSIPSNHVNEITFNQLKNRRDEFENLFGEE